MVTVNICHTFVILSGCSHVGVIKRVPNVQLLIGEHWVAAPNRTVTPHRGPPDRADASPEKLRMRCGGA